ncbi:transmembrane protein 131 homolog [Drosophila novamexicana]|uniref:transmembrane protein 131 homolog n=1 Tax=Drosophila novamexicana TaxID=47314 RepID=UPI0011E5DA05|nr:transmembrane protein 131 homolog [Drosophila novamexicana]
MYPTNSLPSLLLLLLLLVIVPAKGSQQMGGSREKVLSGLQAGFIGLEESQTLPEPHTREQVELLRQLNFVPPAIDFGRWSVGQTVTQIVTLFNQHTNRTVHLNSVAGPSPVFYSSFFGTREVPPQGNTTFSIVFLPRQLGAISTGLLIQTSFGRAEFAVRGEGSECPYRLKPLVGIKAPMNATLTPEIHMYNPHERPLQILEVYSSGGEFQLELPSGGSEGPQNLWEIPPHSLKPVIRISFHGRTAGNHSAYIRIKIAEQAAADDDASPLQHLNENVLVIPVEFEILPRHGAYARNPLADFGRLTTDEHADALHFKLDMQNQPVDAAQQQLIGNYLRDIPGLSYDAHDASIVLDPRLFDDSASINDILVISSGEEAEQQQQFTVLVRAEIFKGGLHYDRNVTLFISSSSVDEPSLEKERTLVVRNNFAFPLKLYNLSLTEPIDPALLQLSSLEHELLLQPGESVELLQLKLLNEQATFKSVLLIVSNVTIFELPVVACSGRLHVSTQQYTLQLPKESEYGLELDLGTVPFAEKSRDGYIILRNDNPMPIKITNWNFKPPKNVYFQAAFMGCVSSGAAIVANNTTIVNPAQQPENVTGFRFCDQLGVGDSVVFILSIQTYVAEESTGTLKVWTPYELIRSTVRFKASVGQLDIEQDQLQFKSCFPGKICSAVLSIRSSFMHPVHVKSISFTRAGLRFKDFNAKGSLIGAQTLTKVGRIYFEPAALCGSACYIRATADQHSIFPSNSGAAVAVGHINNNLLYDGVEVRQRTELYRQFKRQLHAMSLTLHSEELPPLELDFSIAIEWPKLVQYQPLPPTPAIEVGQVQRQWITMTNPTMQPLLLDYFLSDPAYARRTQLSLPHEVIDVSSSSCYLTDQDVFSLPDAPYGGPVLLHGGATLTIPVQFSAQQPDKYCTLLHVRSNLTLYEAVWLTARAVQSQFRLGNRRPGSSAPLLFEFGTEQFERCDGSFKPADNQNTDVVSSHTVSATRSFTARNAGVLPIRIGGFLIGKRSCEGYGFRVLDCQSFELGENETRKIEISFSTDFTASRVQRTLTLLTNLSYDISYQLVAQLPAESVERCAASLPRPTWEPALRNVALVLLLASFCLVLLAGIFDARAIMAQQSAYDAARYKGPVQPTFNLRNIVKMQVAEEAAAAAAAATATALKAEQQQKLRNGQLKELRKRTTTSSTADKVTATRKPKSWTAWSMDMTSCEPKAAAVATVAAVAAQPKPSSSPKPSKKTTSAPVQTPPVAVRAPKKPKQTMPVIPMPKPKVEPVAVETQEKRSSPNAKAIGSNPQQENVSPRSLKTNPDTPKERVLKEQNGSAKKLGKTPGRERRKEQKLATLNGGTSGKKSSAERKQRSKQLNFNGHAMAPGGASPLTTPEADTLTISSPWETSSRVSFRDVLQTKPLPAVDNGLNWDPSASDLASSQLGPIGSRKSLPAPAKSLYQPLMTPETTATSNALIRSLFANSEAPAMDLNMELPDLNDLCGSLYEREQPPSQWERSELILKQQLLLEQLEQQRKQEQQQQQQQKLMLMESNNWAMNQATAGTTWTPLGYAAWPNQSAAAAPQRTSPAHTLTPGVGVIRPPPGLESTYNNCHLPAAGAGAGAAAATNNNGNHSNNHLDGLNALQNAQDRAQHNMPTQYDPFTSPSSIWSDNWRQRNNHMN